MMKAITNTWNTLIDTLTLVGRYRTASLYPLLSYSITLVVTFSVIEPLFEGVVGPDRRGVLAWVFFSAVVYLAYGVLYFVIVFCNVTLVTDIAARLDGGAPGGAMAHLARTLLRLRPIGFYTLVSAGLGLISILTRLFNPFFGGVIMPVAGDKLWERWRHLSYTIPLRLAIPVIALDQPPAEYIFKRVELLVKETWGERVKPAHSVKLLMLLMLPILILFAIPTLRQGLVEPNRDLIRLGLSVLLIAISTFIQISAVVNAIFGLAAYRYATARKSDVFPGDVSYTKHAFVKPKKTMAESAAPIPLLPVSPPVVTDDPSN